jgi:predicted Rdx family selenoprotein
MSIAAALIYWVIVAVWLVVLTTIVVFYIRNPRTFGTTRLLLAVIGIDTIRNIIENVYFGLYFGGQYGLFSSEISKFLGNPYLLIVPKHFFVQDIIEERKPLANTARRAGWVGCNILLNRIPDSGKIFYVRNGEVLPKDAVLYKWQQTLFLRDENVEARGWLIEVMKCVESIGKHEFELDDVYAFERQLNAIYPNNRHVKQKIRQQLQVLRDNGYLEFVSRGAYRLKFQN